MFSVSLIFFDKTTVNTCIHKNMTVRESRCTHHNVSCNASLSSPSWSAYDLWVGTPNSDATVPLPARLVTEQARIICQQITTLPNSCPPGVLANNILMEEIFHLQHWLIHLRGNLGKGYSLQHHTTRLCRKDTSSSTKSNQVKSSATQEAEDEIDRIQLDVHLLKAELSKHLTF